MIDSLDGTAVPLKNRLLAALPSEDFGLISPHLTHNELEKGRHLYDPGDQIEVVYFPHDCVISLMTLMENGAAIESAPVGREGALGLMAAVAPRQRAQRQRKQEHSRDRPSHRSGHHRRPNPATLPRAMYGTERFAA